MAEGVANFNYSAHGMAKVRHGLVRQGMAKGVANLTIAPKDGRTEARYSDARYG